MAVHSDPTSNCFLARLDPELAPVVTTMPVRDYRDIPTTRAMIAEILERSRSEIELPTEVERRDHLMSRAGAPAVPIRTYRPGPRTSRLPCLYWVHGGGHVLGSVDQDDLSLCRIAARVGCVVAAVEWHQAPEHPFPAEFQDCFQGLLWVRDQPEGLGIDPGRIAVGGASSGAGTAAGIALKARDTGDLDLVFQLLVYPMLDDRNRTPSSHSVTYPRVWNRTSNLLAWAAYLGGIPDADVPAYAAPARATDLSGLPPAFVAVGDLDLFLDEDIDYARRLMRAGVPTELHVYPGAVHGFDSFAPQSAIARRFARDRDDALRRALHATAGQPRSSG
jgi:acetyl esterase/lipase